MEEDASATGFLLVEARGLDCHYSTFILLHQLFTFCNLSFSLGRPCIGYRIAKACFAYCFAGFLYYLAMCSGVKYVYCGCGWYGVRTVLLVQFSITRKPMEAYFLLGLNRLKPVKPIRPSKLFNPVKHIGRVRKFR